MTDEKFCEIESKYSGEHMDKVEQLSYVKFTGRELKEFLECALDILGVEHNEKEECVHNWKYQNNFRRIFSFGSRRCTKCNEFRWPFHD